MCKMSTAVGLKPRSFEVLWLLGKKQIFWHFALALFSTNSVFVYLSIQHTPYGNKHMYTHT